MPPAMSIAMVPIIHYQARCHDCGWTGLAWSTRADADRDVDTHTCKEADSARRPARRPG
jgi:hypothetical protein